MKKYALRTLAVVAAVVAIGYFGAWSYVRTAYRQVVAHAKANVPIEFDIQRIRGELDQLDPDVRSSISALAEEAVKVQSLKQEIAERRANLEEKKKTILTMKADLETGNEYIVYGDNRYPASRIRNKLARDFDLYKTAEKEVKTKERQLEHRERALAAHKEQIAQMRSVKEQLELELSRLEAEYEMVKATEVKSPVQFDGSRLASIKDSVKDLRERIETRKKEQTYLAEFTKDPTIDVEQKTKNSNVVKDVDAYFNGDKAGKSDRVAEKK